MVVVDRLLEPLGRPQWRWQRTWVAVAFALVIWAAVGLGKYSGEGAPPMYGDFEAQRHWMEITQHLPAKEWYYYDLEWWGLDYPPLTAYHSWLCGWLGSFWTDGKEWFALDTSRGIEGPELKAFMRNSALVSQAIVFVPAISLYSRLPAVGSPGSRRDRLVAMTAVLLQPALVLVDHGHFQYNAVMLGLFVLALVNLERGHLCWASLWFMLSLFFKQMALYYAPVIFMAILARCVGAWYIRWRRLVAVGTVVVATAVALLAPFIPGAHLGQVAFRVFPFARGLWEDKVANLWCAVNAVYKLKQRFSLPQLQKLSLAATLVGIVPSCAATWAITKRRRPLAFLVWAFAHCAWAFYLLSFQVHEKSVLLPLLPTTLGMFIGDANSDAMVLWINNVAYFSLWPLLNREGLVFQYFVVFLLWNWLLSVWQQWPRHWFNKLVVAGSYVAAVILLAVELSGAAPARALERFPDLFAVLNVLISFGCFAYFWLWQGIYLLGLCI